MTISKENMDIFMDIAKYIINMNISNNINTNKI